MVLVEFVGVVVMVALVITGAYQGYKLFKKGLEK